MPCCSSTDVDSRTIAQAMDRFDGNASSHVKQGELVHRRYKATAARLSGRQLR